MARILYDAFFHHLPGHRIGDEIAVGGYAVNYGRYALGDCYHPNGLSFLHADLARRHELSLLTEPYSDKALSGADILLVTNPDYPLYDGASPYRWTPKDVDALFRFLERGGSVLLMVNSFLSRPDYWEENFDYERVSLLFDRIGVRWDPNYMSDDDNIEPTTSGQYRIGYGQGGRVLNAQLPENVEPLLTYQGNIYGFHTTVGNGKLVVLGDTGMISNGLICFPGFQNAVFFNELFTSLQPGWCTPSRRQWDFRRYGHISAAPGKVGMNEDFLRGLRPGAEWIEDHHYRHLFWTGTEQKGMGEEVWQAVPLDLHEMVTRTQVEMPLHWVSPVSDDPGATQPFTLTVNASRQRETIEMHIIGRVESADANWPELGVSPERMAAVGQIEKAHALFELKAVLDTDGTPRSAFWSQGQILYAVNSNSLHYGYNILLHSDNGIIMPRHGDAGDGLPAV